MKNTVKTQTSKDKIWYSEADLPVAYERTTPFERKLEKTAAKFHKTATDLNGKLASFKEEIDTICRELHSDYMKSKNVDAKSKGNWTFFNFDRSIKIEVSVNEQVSFDDLTMAAAKEKLDTFLSQEITTEDSIIKEMVLSAFETRNSRLDSKKVMSLLRYRDRVKSELFKEALDLIQSSIRKPDSKTYFRIHERMQEGSYHCIALNFSSVSNNNI